MRKVEKIRKPFFLTARILYRYFYARPIEIIRLTMNLNRWCSHKSYYPELKPKSKLRIYFDQILQVYKFGYPNEYYFSYGFDVKSSKQMDEYFHYGPFMQLRDKYNLSQHGSTCILRNKFFFGMFCDYLGIKSGEILGLLSDNRVFQPSTKQSIVLDDFCKSNNGEFFVKKIDGECGKGIFKLLLKDGNIYLDGKNSDVSEIDNLCERSTYIIQRTVVQHPDMAKLHPQSLNTMRLVTIKNINTGQISILPSILRIGTGSSYVDNTSQGGVAVGIDFSTGNLKTHGFLKPQFGGRVDRHPDSNIKFDEFQIPFLNQAIEQAKFLHSKLPDIHSIGWDIAISPEGPVFIEGNDNWEINGPQICNGGLKKQFLECLALF